MKKGFSLIELLISLIIISLLIAAFMPLITKKLKASDTTVGSFGNNSTSGGGVSIQRSVTKQDCDKLNAIYIPIGPNVIKPLCVMKYNIGDTGIEDWSGVQKCKAGDKNCKVQNGTSEDATIQNLQATCWVATSDKNTADAGCNKNFGGYDGCKRTICNWTGAYQMCNNIGWRLPTMSELQAFTNSTYSSEAALKSETGSLMFCDNTSNSTIAPICLVLKNDCSGTYDGNCNPHNIWSSSFESSFLGWDRRLAGGWYNHSHYLGYGFSARCVLDSISENYQLPNKEKCNCQNGTCENDKAYCTKCNEGYKLVDDVCIKEGTEIDCNDFYCASCSDKNEGSCLTCKKGYVEHHGKCYFGSLEGCINPSYDDTYHRIMCEDCETNYAHCDSGSCRLTSALSAPCPANMKKIRCTCVTKYNMGDGYYDETLGAVHICTPGVDCAIKNGGKNPSATARNLQAACWTGKGGGKTAASGCNDNYGGYDGCRRTLCNWTGAQKMCESMGWRLPTMPELTIFTNETYSSSSALTSEGGSLMLCDSSTSSISPVCPQLQNGCSGTYDNYCYSRYVWSSSFENSSNVWCRALSVSWYNNADFLTNAFSTRCVKDL